jgi:chromatin segregation and condensation protein Rec8/ScpA/Scc1 (kleisin family)
MSPQRIQNELGLAARRAKLAPTAEEYAQATDAVAQGRTPQEAIAELAAKKPTPSAPAAETPAPKKARASKAPIPTDKDELLEYAKLIRAGKTHKQAMTAIAQQRALAKQFGTPSVAEVEARVDARNRTGRWPKADQ